MFLRKTANKRRYNFPPGLISVSALPCKTGNTEITSFYFNADYDVCCFANKNTKHVKIISCHRDTSLYFTRKKINRGTWHMAQSVQRTNMHTVGVHHVCHNIEHKVKYWRLFWLTWKVRKVGGHYQ